MKKSSKPRVNPFSGNPYGTYEGHRGSAKEWKSAFGEAIDPEEAKRIIQDNSPWAILGIDIDSPVEIIKKAYRKLAFEFHPDRHSIEKKEWAEEQFKRVQAAYSLLVR